jgi:hypothetical protein
VAATAPARGTTSSKHWDSPPSSRGDCPETLRLAPAARGQLLVGALRLVLGAAGLAAAFVAGLASGPGLLAFAVGAFGFLVSIGTAERAFADGGEPEPAPEHQVEPPVRTLIAAAFPSTVGVAVLLAISLGVNAALAALLAGVEAGMGAAALLTAARIRAQEQALGGRLLVDRRARRVYVD